MDYNRIINLINGKDELYDEIINNLIYYITIPISDINVDNYSEYEYTFYCYYNYIINKITNNNINTPQISFLSSSASPQNHNSIISPIQTTTNQNQDPNRFEVVTDWRYYNDFEWISVCSEVNIVLNRCQELNIKKFNFIDSLGINYGIDLDEMTLTFSYNQSNPVPTIFLLSHLTPDELFESYITSLVSIGIDSELVYDILLSDENGCTHAYQQQIQLYQQQQQQHNSKDLENEEKNEENTSNNNTKYCLSIYNKYYIIDNELFQQYCRNSVYSNPSVNSNDYLIDNNPIVYI